MIFEVQDSYSPVNGAALFGVPSYPHTPTHYKYTIIPKLNKDAQTNSSEISDLLYEAAERTVGIKVNT